MVDIVHSELGKRPNMWSPLEWNPESPPRQLVTSQAILNLWTGDLSALAYNMTKSGTNQVVTSVGWCKCGSSVPARARCHCFESLNRPMLLRRFAGVWGVFS